MIVTFSIENFLSFNEEETFSMVASNRLSGSHENHLVPIPGSDAKVLRGSVLYGANGAGKSNFFKALSYLQEMVLEGRGKGTGTGRTAFRFREDPEAPSQLDLQFIAGDNLYRFGVMLDDERIIEEWLIEVDGNRDKPIYERATDEEGKVTVKGLKNAGKKLRALTTVGGPKEQSFLATIQTTLDQDEHGPVREVIDWFKDRIRCIRPDSHLLMLGHILSINQEFRSFAGNFLHAASTGVDALDVSRERISEDQLKDILPTAVFEESMKDADEENTVILGLPDGREVLIQKDSEHRYYLLRIQSIHQHEMSREILFGLADESDGTRRLLHLLPALHRLHTDGGVFVIDEIGRSMHPLLVHKFMEFFFQGCKGDQRQLIVTTHESNLLDQQLLRRDEIWFSEKNKKGVTSLYSLADFQPRKDLKLDKHYLQGRFGAIPFLGEIDQITSNIGSD